MFPLLTWIFLHAPNIFTSDFWHHLPGIFLDFYQTFLFKHSIPLEDKERIPNRWIPIIDSKESATAELAGMKEKEKEKRKKKKNRRT